MSIALPAAARDRVASVLAKKSFNLSLARMGLTDDHLLLIDWSALDFVGALDLSGNRITRLPHKLVESMSQLQELSLYKNQIEEIPRGVMLFFRSLDTLLLSDNRLKSLPADFGKLAKLRVLSLSSNRFSGIPIQLAQCRALERVDMDDNQLSDSFKKHLTNLGDFLKTLPTVGMCGFGTLLSQSSTCDDLLTIDTLQGLVERPVHRCIVQREPLFRCASSIVGDGRFSAAAWDMVVSFLYTAVVRSSSKEEFEELAALVHHHKLESLLHLVEREQAERKESGSHDDTLLTVLEDSLALAGHVEHLLVDEEGGFEVVGSDGVAVRAHEAVLEARLGHFRAMLGSKWREAVERRVSVEWDSATTRSLLEWVYCDTIGLIYECDLVNVMQAARFLAIDDLSLELQTAIADNLDATNAQFVYELAAEEQLPTLLKLTSSFCRVHSIKVA